MAAAKDEDQAKQTLIVRLATLGVTALAGMIASKVLAKVWMKATGHETPDDPASDDISTKEIIAFAAISGALAAVAQAAANRGTVKTANKLSERAARKLEEGKN